MYLINSKYSTQTLHRYLCPLAVKSYIIKDEGVNHQAPRQYAVLDRNFMFVLNNAFQEHNTDIKTDLPVTLKSVEQGEEFAGLGILWQPQVNKLGRV